jgi:integrase/recombinase XerD
MADGKSPQTTPWYLGKLRIFGRYLENNGYPTELREITTAHIRPFLVHLHSEVEADQHNPSKHGKVEPLSGLAIQGYVRTLKAFYSWLVRQEYIEDNPMRHIRIPRAPKVIIETFDDEQVERLLAAVDVRKPLGSWDYCMLLILLDTGMQLSELAGLHVQDVDLKAGEFKVTGKGQKQRPVPMGRGLDDLSDLIQDVRSSWRLKTILV